MIHPTAIVDSKAEIAADASVGPYCTIGPEVVLSHGVKLHSHVALQGKTSIGENTEVFSFAVLGTPSQDLKFKGNSAGLEIGAHNIIREHVSIHLSNSSEEKTIIGDHNFIMGAAHVGHNCRMGDHNVLTQGSGLAGHVQVEDNVIIGGHVAVHQFARIGRYAMVGGKAAVLRDIPPYVMVHGLPACFTGMNRRALERNSMAPEVMDHIQQALKILFQNGLTPEKGIERIQEEVPLGKEVKHLIQFIQETDRGICN